MKKSNFREYTEEELQELENITDLSSESMLVGSFFKSEESFLSLERYMNSQYDFFDHTARRLYESYALCYKTYSNKINSDTFTQFMMNDQARGLFYEEIGGWDFINTLIGLCDETSYEKYFSRVKKYALLREYYRKGFPSKKIMNMKNFEEMTPDDVLTIMQTNLDRTFTEIGGGRQAINLGVDARSRLIKLRETPDIGHVIADWKLMTSMIRGLRKKKLSLIGMQSNRGKTRMALYMAVHIALLQKKPVLFIANETDDSDSFLCALTTILNAPAFEFEKEIREEVMATGSYTTEEEFQEVMQVAEWFENNSNLYFLETTSYTDKDLRREINKYVIGKGVEVVVYDTLKNSTGTDWGELKGTATFLKDLATELNIHMYCTFQLTDSVSEIAPDQMTSMNIASSKHIRHLADSMFLYEKIEPRYFSRYEFQTTKEMNSEWGVGTFKLDENKEYYYSKCLKNRAGKKLDTIFEIDLDFNKWKEVGFAQVVKTKKGE